jgi:toxin secretion/phage lysis holin
VEKWWNTASVVFGLVGGVCLPFLGGMDAGLHALLFFMIADFLTGLFKAGKKHTLNSSIGFIGLFKKATILMVVAVSVELEHLTNNVVPFREAIVMFYVANEGISLLENMSEFVPLPEKLKDYFMQIRSKTTTNDKGETKK